MFYNFYCFNEALTTNVQRFSFWWSDRKQPFSAVVSTFTRRLSLLHHYVFTPTLGLLRTSSRKLGSSSPAISSVQWAEQDGLGLQQSGVRVGTQKAGGELQILQPQTYFTASLQILPIRWPLTHTVKLPTKVDIKVTPNHSEDPADHHFILARTHLDQRRSAEQRGEILPWGWATAARSALRLPPFLRLHFECNCEAGSGFVKGGLVSVRGSVGQRTEAHWGDPGDA